MHVGSVVPGQQTVDGQLAALRGGHVQRGAAVVVRRVRVCTAGSQELERLYIAVPSCLQPGAPYRVCVT